MDTKSLLSSPLFSRRTDPKTGVNIYLLAASEGQRAAPVQQSFYYVNQSMACDSRYHWFYCAYPPSGSAHGGRTLAVADFVESRIHHFPETQFLEASPFVDPETGWVFWGNSAGIWTRGPNPHDPSHDTRLVSHFVADFIANRPVSSVATHLTRSPDGKAFVVDARIGDTWYLGLVPLGGGPLDVWFEKTGMFNHNHAQANPTDARLILYANDHYVERREGQTKWIPRRFGNRMWLARRGDAGPFPVHSQSIATEPGERVLFGNPDRRSRHCHEWWSADGKHIWYIHNNRGVERVALADVLAGAESRPPANPRTELVWPHPLLAHAHSNHDDTALVLDSPLTDDWGVAGGWHVQFVNLATRKIMDIVSSQPSPISADSRYHVHPHPQFCVGDELICFTTTVRDGRPDVAFASVGDLLRMTS
ncbi:hypothetical protein OpiT1DRAFT_00689 [Opitutaceae bacterium TAV1]|nr:hypothetical protein OpiT1DRAFT_00689 [Opitutaceae bacterium TAV1]